MAEHDRTIGRFPGDVPQDGYVDAGDLVHFLPTGHVAAVTKVLRVEPGKNVQTLGDPDARTSLIIDRDSAVTTDQDGVARSSRILAEIHEDVADIVIGHRGIFRVAVGPALAMPREARTSDGAMRPGELIGDGVKDAKIIDVYPGDILTILPGVAHVHGTVRPGTFAHAIFIKKPTTPRR